MKILFLTLALSFSIFIGFGQANLKIEYKSGDSVLVNGKLIDNTFDYKQIVELIARGEPEVYREYPNGKIKYHYKELGIALYTINGKLNFLGVNYNWDGDKNFPNSTFTGEYKVGNVIVDKSMNEDFLVKIKDFEVQCIIPGMCMNNPTENKYPIIIGFKEGLISQVGVEFK